MKKFLFTFLFLFLSLCLVKNINAQDIQVIVHETNIQDTLGVVEIVFDFEVVNISQSELAVFEVRTINDMPQDWTSSLCFGENCYAPFIDSIATGDGLQPNLQPGDTLITSLHVTPNTVVGTSHTQIQVGTLRNPNDRYTLDFYATAVLTDINDFQSQFTYTLDQNYPNPFNPSTKISWQSEVSGWQTLKVYDILGTEITTLVNEYRPAGNHEVVFDADKLPSGVYFYTIRVNDFVQTRKMILEK